MNMPRRAKAKLFLVNNDIRFVLFVTQSYMASKDLECGVILMHGALLWYFCSTFYDFGAWSHFSPHSLSLY